MVVVHLQNCTWRTSLRCGPRGRGAGTSQRAPLVACTSGTFDLRRVWANAGRGHADAHVQRLPCSEGLQRRSPKDGFEKSRIGREPVDGAAQGYIRSAQQSGARLSRTVWRLTRALRTWWHFCSDECAMPQRFWDTGNCLRCLFTSKCRVFIDHHRPSHDCPSLKREKEREREKERNLLTIKKRLKVGRERN